MSKINMDDVKESLAGGAKSIRNLLIEIYGESLNQAAQNAFSDAIEYGISTTIASLYDANVDDDEIIRILNKFWGICKEESEDRLLFEKRQATKRELENHLKMQGMNPSDIKKYMGIGGASMEINHNPNLWKLKNNPEKLKYEIDKLLAKKKH